MNDCLVLVELLSYQGRGDDILLIVGQVGKEPNPLQALSILVVIADDDFLYSFSEGLPVDQPQAYWFLGLNRASSLRIIK